MMWRPFLFPSPLTRAKRRNLPHPPCSGQKAPTEEARKQALEELFKTLLYNLMTGKIRVKDVVLPNVGEGKGMSLIDVRSYKKLTGRDY